MTDTVISVHVNPLAFLEAEAPWADPSRPVTSEAILKFLCVPGTGYSTSEILDRYRRVSVETPRLFAAPAEERLLERLVWPLRQAKGSYMVGNCLGTISLCGLVAEMSAILFFDLEQVRLGDAALSIDQQTRAYRGRTFEQLGQEARVAALKTQRLIDDRTKTAFDVIRTRRRRYLHLWSQSHEALQRDSVDCFKAGVALVVAVLGLDVVDGKLLLRPAVLEYLRRNAGRTDDEETLDE